MAELFEDFQGIPEESLVERGKLNVLLENELRERVKKLLKERVEPRRKKIHEEAESYESAAIETVGPHSFFLVRSSLMLERQSKGASRT